MHSKTKNSIRTSLNRLGINGLTSEDFENYELKVLGTNHTEVLNKEDRRAIIDYIENERKSAMIPVENSLENVKPGFINEDTRIQVSVPIEAPTQESEIVFVDSGSPKYQIAKATVESYGLTMSEKEISMLYQEIDGRTQTTAQFMTELSQVVEQIALAIESKGLTMIAVLKEQFHSRISESVQKVNIATDVLIEDMAKDLASINGFTAKKNSTLLEGLNQAVERMNQDTENIKKKLNQPTKS